MPSRHGWGGLVDLDDQAPAEGTDPDLRSRAEQDSGPSSRKPRPEPHGGSRARAAVEEDTDDDPVLAAMRELDGAESIPAAAKAIRPVASARAKVRVEEPSARVAADEPIARFGLSLSEVGANASKRKLVLPGASPANAADHLRATPALDLPGLEGFSGADLVEKLAAEATPQKPPKRPFFSEYRELIIAGAVSGVLVLGLVVYKTWPKTEPDPAKDKVETSQTAAGSDPTKGPTPGPVSPPPAPAPGPSGAAPTGSPALPAAPPVLPVTPAVDPAAAIKLVETQSPMLSVFSEPPGAMVTINGLARGKTPLVIPSPTSEGFVKLRLNLNRYRTWEGSIQANPAGHYTAKIVLEAR